MTDLLGIVARIAIVCIAVGFPATVVAQSTVCAKIAEFVVGQVITKVGGEVGKKIGGDVFDAGAQKASETFGAPEFVNLHEKAGEAVAEAVLEYVKNPSEKKLDAAVQKLAEGGLNIAFPAYGFVMGTAGTLIGSRDEPGLGARSVMAIVAAAESSQLDAFICGDRAFGAPLGGTSFFDMNRMRDLRIGRAHIGRVTCDNFVEKITNVTQLNTMRELWFGYYAKSIVAAENPGVQNSAAAEERLKAGWDRLETRWKVIWAEKTVQNMRAQLVVEGARARSRLTAQTESCPATPSSAVSSAKKPGVSGESVAKAGSGVNFAGVYANSVSKVTISGSGSSVTAQETWASGGRNGTGTWNCIATANALKCNWTGKYLGDPDKTADRRGTLTAVLNGNRLTGTFYEDEPTFHWNVKPYPSGMHKGATWPLDLVRT